MALSDDHIKAIIKVPYPGYIQTTVKRDGTVGGFSGETVEQYLARNPDCKVITWEELEPLNKAKWEHPFVPIKESDYDRYHEQLPPLKYITAGRFSGFFQLEATASHYHGVCVVDKVTGLYFAGTMSIFASMKQIEEAAQKALDELLRAANSN